LSSDTIVPPIVFVSAEADEVRTAVSRTLRAYGVRQLDGSPRARAVATAARMVHDVILVIADQQLKDPAALVTQLRVLPATRDTPIVVRLGPGARATSDTLLAAGADRVLNDGPESAALAGTLFRLSDITPQRRAIRELRRRLAPLTTPTLAHLTSALQQFRTLMIAADSTGRCVALNDAALMATAFSREDVIGHPVWKLLEAANGRDLRANWSTLLVVGALQGPCTLRRKYASPAPVQICVAAHVVQDVHVAAIQPATT